MIHNNCSENKNMTRKFRYKTFKNKNNSSIGKGTPHAYSCVPDRFITHSSITIKIHDNSVKNNW